MTQKYLCETCGRDCEILSRTGERYDTPCLSCASYTLKKESAQCPGNDENRRTTDIFWGSCCGC